METVSRTRSYLERANVLSVLARRAVLPVGLLLVVWLFGVATAAAAAGADAAAATPAATQPPAWQWPRFLGPFHTVFLHFPIGFLTIAFLLELLYFYRPSHELRKIIGLIIAIGMLSGALVAALGLLRAQGGGYDPATLDLHKKLGLVVPALALVTLGFHQWALHHGDKRSILVVYRVLLGCTMVVLTLAGHHGGNLTHGSDYLVKDAPPLVKTMLKGRTNKAPVKKMAAATEAEAETGQSGEEIPSYYHNAIQPILDAKCLRCHGPEKKKGGIRVDRFEHLLATGESGIQCIVPGKPLESRLIQLILLPRDHDEVMPPAGKEALTADEILALIHWVQDGAPTN